MYICGSGPKFSFALKIRKECLNMLFFVVEEKYIWKVVFFMIDHDLGCIKSYNFFYPGELFYHTLKTQFYTEVLFIRMFLKYSQQNTIALDDMVVLGELLSPLDCPFKFFFSVTEADCDAKLQISCHI